MPNEPVNAPPPIPDHELLRCVGRGSYGEVWLARNIMGTFRAVKIVHRATFKEDRPFEREFNGIQKFEPVSRTHPGLVSVLHVGRNASLGCFYYVMEVADDVATGQAIDPEHYTPRTLFAELVRRRQFPPQESVRLAGALASALGHLHEHGLIHRDIKPSNIIFVCGQPKFADIGLVTNIGEAATFVGTAGYMPPEGPGSPRADIYSLGKVLYEVSMGKDCERFPELPTRLHETDSLPVLIRLNQIILKACEPLEGERYQSVRDLQRDLSVLAEMQLEGNAAAVIPLCEAPSTRPCETGPPPTPRPPGRLQNCRITILHRVNTQPDDQLMEYLSAQLAQRGCQVFAEQQAAGNMEWVRKLDTTLRHADAVVVLVSAQAAESEMIAYEVETAWQIAQNQHGRPRLLPVCLRFKGAPPSSLARAMTLSQCFHWEGEGDNKRLVAELVHALESTQQTLPTSRRIRLESIGGAVPLDSEYYVSRPADLEFQDAVARRDSIVLVKGARQMGKTSLLARGLQRARHSGARVVLTDFQKLNAAHLDSVESLFMTLGEFLADQLDLNVLPGDVWDKRRSPNTNFERYLRREVLKPIPEPLVWGLDEVDRLFTCPFGSEVFGLFRSWHNERALDPGGPWSRLTLAIAYATEAHLFITDLNQSPFNVGTRLALDDFTPEQVADLNQRHGAPLATEADLQRFYALVGGQPYLVRRALNELASGTVSFTELAAHADHDEGIFGDHLRRILVLLTKDDELRGVVGGLLRGETCPGNSRHASFYRLRSAGLVKGDSPQQAQLRCEIYASYLRSHLT